MEALRLLFGVAFFAAQSYAYSTGPPVNLANVCTDMVPTGHRDGDAQAMQQTSEVPYDLVVSGDCYKAGTTLKLRIRIMGDADASKYFEGFFVQAKAPGTNDMNYGTFDALNTDHIQALTCFGNTDSAIGHSAHAHFWARTFEWTAPDSDVGDLQFVATIVKGQATFWVDVRSGTISYDANCMADNTLADETYTDIDSSAAGSSEEMDSAETSDASPPECSPDGVDDEGVACGAEALYARTALLLAVATSILRMYM